MARRHHHHCSSLPLRRSARLAAKYPSEHFFPAQIRTEILSHLPIKSLLRFRSVCTTWRSIIEDPDFVFLHLRRCPSNILKSHLMLWDLLNPENVSIRNIHTLEQISKVEFPVNDAEPHWWLLKGTVNGIFLLCNMGISTRFSPDDVILWNPSIRRHLCLPHPLTRITNTASVLEFYLGFDSSHGDHKVIMIIWTVPLPSVEVFSLKTRTWHKLESETRIHHVMNLHHENNHVTLDGSIHWIGEELDRTTSEIKEILVSFDVASESFSYTLLPDTANVDRKMIRAIVVGGCHPGIIVPRDSSHLYSTVWILTSSRNWTKWCEINLDPDPTLCRKLGSFNQLQFNQLLFMETSTETPNAKTRLLLYDPATQERKVVSLDASKSFPRYVDTYMESLVLL